MDLNKLNTMNYYVSDGDDNWYATNGLRSLFIYSKYSYSSLREICTTLLKIGEITVRSNVDVDKTTFITITMV